MKWRNIRRPATSSRRVVWKYAQADFGKACSLIEGTKWDALISNDVNVSLKNWQNNFLIEECIPKQTLPRRKNLPWMSRNLVRAMRKRNRLYRQARKRRNPSLLNCYKRERNRVVRELRRAKRDYYFRNLNPNNTKQFWKTVKLMNKQKTSIPTLNRNGMAPNEDSERPTSSTNTYLNALVWLNCPWLMGTIAISKPLVNVLKTYFVQKMKFSIC